MRSRRLQLLLLLLLPSLLVAGCTSAATLSSAGSRIRVLKAVDDDACRYLEDIEKSNTNSVQSKEASEEDARNKVLNAAANAGGSHIIMHGYKPWLEGTCSNCVKFSAAVYACEGPVDDMTVVDRLFQDSPQNAEPPAENTPPATAEKNHADHDNVCTAVGKEPDSGDACQYDTECVICHDGSDCGRATSREVFTSEGPACAQQDAAECEQTTAYCCFGKCVVQ